MIVQSADEWQWEVVAISRHEHFILQKATGKKDKEGWIGIPAVELCTFTVLKSGLLAICDWDSKKELGVMGPNVRFHYSYLMDGYEGRVDYYGNPLPPKDEILATASKTHVRLKTVSDESVFYCISDPYDNVIWDGDSYVIDKEDYKNIIEPNNTLKFIPLDDGIKLNNKPTERYKIINLAIYDAPIEITGMLNRMYAIVAPNGVYKKPVSTQDVPRYVRD